MIDRILHIDTAIALSVAATIIAISLFLASCEDSGNEETVLVAVKPASVEIGESVTVELSALEPVFSTTHIAPVSSSDSGNGIVISELSVLDDRHAIASINTSRLTGPGIHAFELDFGNTTARFEISVVPSPEGPGTAAIENNRATAGAKYAKFSIWGTNTHFDSEVDVYAENADGMQIILTDVKTETWIEVSYEIDINQEPTTATIVLSDGQDQYQFPFEIAQPAVFNNELTNQVLARGQVGKVSLRGQDAMLYAATHPVNIPENIEYSATRSTTQGAEFFMRVPADYGADVLKLDCHTYIENGAELEIITTEIPIVDPLYAVPIPSIVPANGVEVQTGIFTNDSSGQPIAALGMTPDDNIVNLKLDPDGSMSWMIGSTIEHAGCPFTVTFDNNYTSPSQIVIEREDALLSVAKSSYYLGDRDFLQVALSTNNLLQDAVSLEGDDCVEVLDTIIIDSGTVIFDLAICDDADVIEAGSPRQLLLHNGDESYQLGITLHDAGLMHGGTES